MSIFSLLRVEVQRIFYSRMTWLIMALTILAPLAGYSFYRPVFGDTMASLYLANPIVAGTLAGTLLFAVLMLYELNRVHRNSTDTLTDSMVSPLKLSVVRLLAVWAAAFVTVVMTLLIYLPYTIWKLGIVFTFGTYLLCFLLFLLPGLMFGSLAAALCYQIVRRVDISLLLVLIFLIFSRSGEYKDRFLMQWSVPTFPGLSDDFSNALIYRTAFYSRLVWLLFLGALWLLSLLCVRRYSKGMIGSIAKNIRNIWMPILSLLLILGGGLLWRNQPFIDHTPVDYMSIPNETHFVEGLFLTRTELEAGIDSYFLGTLSGTGTYHIENTTGQKQEIYLGLNSGYTIRGMTANGQPIEWEDLKNDYIARRSIRCTIPSDADCDLQIVYGGMPKVWNAMESSLNGAIISRSFLNLSSHSLAPVPEILVKDENTPLSLNITMDEALKPVSTGEAAELIQINADGSCTWQIRDTDTNRVILYAGDYIKADLDGAGTPVEFYYSQKHQATLEKIDAIPMMEAAIAYCTKHFGPKKFDSKKPFRLVQNTVFLFGGQAFDNISTMAEGNFSMGNMSDSDKGASGAEVLAHEIIHQWWGLSAQLMDQSDPNWTDEGITTYTTYRLMKELKGEAYADKHYLQKWEDVVSDNSNNFYIRHPEYLSILPEKYAAGLKAETQSVNWYDGTALMIQKAAALSGGEDAMDQIWADFFLNGGTEMPPYISLNDFLNACGLTKEVLGRD